MDQDWYDDDSYEDQFKEPFDWSIEDIERAFQLPIEFLAFLAVMLCGFLVGMGALEWYIIKEVFGVNLFDPIEW